MESNWISAISNNFAPAYVSSNLENVKASSIATTLKVSFSFLGYTATDQNIVCLDLDTGIVKQSHHAQFDEAWYLQDLRPSAAKLLFDLGVLDDAATTGVLYDESVVSEFCLPGTIKQVQVPWPPCAPGKLLTLKEWQVPDVCTRLPLPLPHMLVVVPTR